MRLKLLELGHKAVVAVGREKRDQLEEHAPGVDIVYYLAGISRENDDVVENGYRELAERLTQALECHCGTNQPPTFNY